MCTVFAESVVISLIGAGTPREDLLAHLEKQPSQNAYILELIRRDLCDKR